MLVQIAKKMSDVPKFLIHAYITKNISQLQYLAHITKFIITRELRECVLLLAP